MLERTPGGAERFPVGSPSFGNPPWATSLCHAALCYVARCANRRLGVPHWHVCRCGAWKRGGRPGLVELSRPRNLHSEIRVPRRARWTVHRRRMIVDRVSSGCPVSRIGAELERPRQPPWRWARGSESRKRNRCRTARAGQGSVPTPTSAEREQVIPDAGRSSWVGCGSRRSPWVRRGQCRGSCIGTGSAVRWWRSVHRHSDRRKGARRTSTIAHGPGTHPSGRERARAHPRRRRLADPLHLAIPARRFPLQADRPMI
jgi:hypothetical protein